MTTSKLSAFFSYIVWILLILGGPNRSFHGLTLILTHATTSQSTVESTVSAEPTSISTESTATTESTVSAEPTSISTESTATTESTVSAEPTSISTESTATTESTVSAEPTSISTESTATTESTVSAEQKTTSVGNLTSGEATTNNAVQTTHFTVTPIAVCEDYCKWPWPNTLYDITSCACPAGTLNIANNCCLSQNWIIGLAVGCGGFAILCLSGVIAYMCCREEKQKTAEERKILTDHAENIARVENEELRVARDTEHAVEDVLIHEEISATAIHNEEVKALNTEPRVPEVSHNNNVKVAEPAIVHNDVDVLVPNGNIVHRTSSKAKASIPVTELPAMDYDALRAELYKEFVPRLDIVDPDKDFSIRRPALNDPTLQMI